VDWQIVERHGLRWAFKGEIHPTRGSRPLAAWIGSVDPLRPVECALLPLLVKACGGDEAQRP
jgi:hypothetical protein